jgi:hypothetical protein
MTELFLMRGNPEVFCNAPFAVDRTLSGEQEAFDYDGEVFCRIADTKRLDCPEDIRAVGDVVEILLSLCWSKKAAAALNGIRWSPTVRMRDIEVRNSKDKVLGVFQWVCDFGRYDVLDRSRSRFDVVKGTNAVLHVEHPVVVKSRLPACDVFRSIYGAELFVTADVKCRLQEAACSGFTFRPVEIA